MKISFTMSDVKEAAEVIEGVATHTPLLLSAQLSKLTTAKIYLKLECFQPTRVFKIRGATNKIKRIPLNKTIVAASSGNHGFAVSYVCNLLGRKAIVCVPKTANPDKLKAIEQYGAEIRAEGSSYEDAYEEALKIRQATGAVMAHPFEDPQVLAGQATIGLELHQDKPDLDTVLVPVGGGGLISGIAFAIKNLNKKTKVIGVQAQNAPTMRDAFRAGKPVPVSISPTIADGMVTKAASELTLEYLQKYVDDVITVSEMEIENAMLDLLMNDHVLAEPSGATPVAALANAYKSKRGEKIAAVISGGNISVAFLSKLLTVDR